MKQKILSFALALCMVLALLPTTALCATDETANLTNAEMIARLPSQAPEVIKPENSKQLEYWRSNFLEPWEYMLWVDFEIWMDNETDTEKIFQEIIEQTKRLTSGARTETEKVQAIFRWIVRNISYDYTAYKYSENYTHDTLTDSQRGRIARAASAVHVFYYRQGICDGYTKLTNLMLTLAGLPTAYISGIAQNTGGEVINHAWSAAYADGRWILLDATWDKWDISSNFHKSIESITWRDGFFNVTTSRTQQPTCTLMTEYDYPSSLTIPDGVAVIGKRAFLGCTDLISVTIPDSVTSIGELAFLKCTSLTSITIPNGVTSIDGSTFYRCASLTDITIPSSVTKIGGDAFWGCRSLTNVYYSGSEAQWDAIDIDNSNDSLTSATIHYNGIKVETSVVPNFGFVIEDGVLSKYKGKGGDVVIPGNVNIINDDAFQDCTGLTSVTIPDSVTEIGWDVFVGCTSLTSVIIPNSVTYIGYGAFSECTSLTSVTLPSNVTEIDFGTFRGCTSLTSVTIPSSVTSIEEWAFRGCTDLTDVYYGGSESQWDAIDIDSGNDSLKNAAIHYNSPMPQQPAEPTVGGFSDVKTGAWYAGPVAWALEKKITTGTSDTAFSPDVTCTQGQILTFLWRAKGEPAPTGAVSGDEYYAKPAQWAAEQGLTDGFSAEADCTRAMVVTYLWKLAGSPKAASSSSFTDVPDTLADAVSWAAEQGITTGTSETTFSPDATCTRGQIVTFLHRDMA